MRSGAQTLALLAAPLNRLILGALAEGPKQQVELRRVGGFPAQTTLRAQLRRLEEIGAIERHRRNRFPGVLDYELTSAGRKLHFVVETIETWLERGPDQSLLANGGAAKAVIKALVEGWSTTILRALAGRPLSLTELDRLIGALSYPSLERRLRALRLAGLIEATPGNGQSTPYAATTWLRLGVAPILAAIRWERRHLPKTTAPIGGIDVEAAFLLAVPLVRPPDAANGLCRLAAEIRNGEKRRLVGVTVEVEDGRILSCATQTQGKLDASALSSPTAWIDALVDRDLERVELSGDCQLAGAFVDGLNEALFAATSQLGLDVAKPIGDHRSN